VCIIVASPQGKIVPKETLAECFRCNPDGAGYMYSDGNELVVEKGFFTFDEFYDNYAPHAEKKIILHFRIKTHGEKNKDNCHPFLISDDMAFVHNGIIKIEEDHPEYSDTWHFNEKIIKPMYRDNRAFLKRLYNQELIKSYIGWSKLVFMDRKGRSSILNAEKGIWDDGVWYSNNSYQPPKKYPIQQYQSKFANKGPSFIEGEMVVFRYDYGKNFQKDDWAYVENVFPNGQLEVIVHRRMDDGTYQEILATVPKYAVKALEDGYV